jgi:hypothetical protein
VKKERERKREAWFCDAIFFSFLNHAHPAEKAASVFDGVTIGIVARGVAWSRGDMRRRVCAQNTRTLHSIALFFIVVAKKRVDPDRAALKWGSGRAPSW